MYFVFHYNLGRLWYVTTCRTKRGAGRSKGSSAKYPGFEAVVITEEELKSAFPQLRDPSAAFLMEANPRSTRRVQ